MHSHVDVKQKSEKAFLIRLHIHDRPAGEFSSLATKKREIFLLLDGMAIFKPDGFDPSVWQDVLWVSLLFRVST